MSSDTPSVRTFQFDGDAVGIIKNSVNMFRGDVNFSLDLITLTGRNQLDVKVTALCQSNIQNDVDGWNLSSPTSVLGLGWAIAGQKIIVDTKGNGSNIDNQYYYGGGDSMEPLYESEIPWLKLNLDKEYAQALNSGQISAGIQSAFAKSGICISLESEVIVIEEGSQWRVIDHQYEYTYKIEADTDALNVYDGGTGFEKQSYEFWKIYYYKEFEKWVITNESGIISVYGGGIETGEGGYGISKGNSIEWGVKWGNWTGASKLTHDSDGARMQQQYPVAWNMAETANSWGDEVTFDYEHETCLVGENGLPYTKSCCLKEITDVFKRKIEFVYGEKEYKLDAPSGTREYIDPHHNDPYEIKPGNSPSAYQDRYETKYLDRINVRDMDRVLLFYMRFGYSFENYSSYRKDDFLYGDTTKRMLRSITQYNAQGDSLPGMEFDYCPKKEQNKGAIKVITYPEGGKGIYTYSEGELPICSRSFTIDNPWDAGDAVPRVWFGGDYVVTAWYNEYESKLKLSVYTWLGRWELWEPEESVIDTSVDIDSLQVIPQKDFFTFSYKYAGVTYVRLFHKNDRFWGKWFEYGSNPITVDTSHTTFASGESFMLVNDTENNELTRYTWKWNTRNWVKKKIAEGADLCESGTVSVQYFITGGVNYYAILCYDKSSSGTKKNRLQLFYLDGKGEWHDGGVIKPEFAIAGADINTGFSWSAGSSMIAATFLTENESSYFKYEVRIFQWNEAFREIRQSSKEYTLKKSNPSGAVTVPYVANIALDSLVTSGPYAQRFNGRDWLKNDDLALKTDPTDETIYWFAAGNDYLLKTENNPYKVVEAMLVFDPDTQVESWETGHHILLDTNDPANNRKRHYYPTGGQNSFSFDRDIYFRGTSTNWISAIQKPGYTVPGEIDTTTMVNQAPEFFIYLLYSGDEADKTDVVILKNDTVKDIESVAQRFYQSISPDGSFVANPGGKYPAGPSSFFTFLPLSKTIDYAESITIHRYVSNSIEKNIKDYSVKNIKIFDGYEEYCTSYKFDVNSAICDPSGAIVKYYKSASYPGCKTPEESAEGWTEQYYLNGLDPTHKAINNTALLAMENAEQNYNVLDGLMYKKIIYDADGKEEEISTYDWGIGLSVEANGKLNEIRGAYVKQNNVASTKDGVAQNTEYKYDKISGQKVSQSAGNCNFDGKEELITEETTYGYAGYERLLRRNILTPVIQTTTKSKIEGEKEIVTAVQAEAWNGFRRIAETGISLELYASHKTYLWNGGEGSPVFNFKQWSGSDNPPAEWLKTSEILVRDNHGLMLEASNVSDIISSTIYDKHGELEVAGFSNSSVQAQQASYYGFEEYENPQGWKVDTGVTPPVYGDAHTGRNSLKIPGMTQKGPSKTITLKKKNLSERYIFTFWLKTEEGFGSVTNESGWKIKLTSGEGVLDEIFIDFTDTDLQWRYKSCVIDLRPFDASPDVKIEMTAVNGNNKYALIDNLRFSPFECEYNSVVYDYRSRQSVAALGPSSRVSRIIYDNFRRKKADTGPAEYLNTIDTSYLSRRGNDNEFNPQDPNSGISVISMYNGFYSRFNDGNNWRLHWQSKDISAWIIENDMIVYDGSGKGTLELKEPEILSDYAVYLNLNPYDTVRSNTGFDIGNNLTIEWESSSKRWKMTDSLNGVSELSSFISEQPEREWMIVLTPGMIFFYADGKQLFNYMPTKPLSGKFKLFTSDKIGFYNILFARKPALSSLFADGTGKNMQTHALIDTSANVGQTVYDSLGREAVNTKAARIFATAESPVMRYIPGFVTSMNWINGEMEGEINTHFPEDKKYPYTRTLFGKSPLARTVEIGAPGKEYAITDLDTTSPGDRHTVKVRYSSNINDSFPEPLHLPAGEYFIITTTDQNGIISKSIADKNETLIASGTLSEDGKYVFSSGSTVYDKYGKEITTRLPNYYTAPASEQGKWMTVQNYDKRDLLTFIRQTDSGTGRVIYDNAGNPRFSQDVLGENKGYILYNKYDIQGRPVESGWLDFQWDEEVLLGYANNDPQWPSSNQPHEICKKMVYDGDGTNPNQVGQLVEAFSFNSQSVEDESEVSERYEYNIAGSIREKVINVKGFGENEYKFSYDYDNAGNIIKINYPEIESREKIEVAYSYDRLGQNTAVGTPGAPESFASYDYSSMGNVRKETLNRGSASELVTDFTYNSPGWLTSLRNKFFEEILEHKGGYGNSAYYDGKIARASTKFDFPQTNLQSGSQTAPGNDSPGFLSRYSYGYSYDNMGYLATAENDMNSEYSIGVSLPVTYDNNGNIKQLKSGNDDKVYEYYEASNKVMNTLGSSLEEYLYNDLGNVISSFPKKITSIEYDRFTQMTTGMTKEDNSQTLNLKFQYSPGNNRVLKSSGDTLKLYLNGAGNNSLLEILKRENSIDEIVFYIYGPSGLLKIVKDAGEYTLIKDYESSTRALLDSSGVISAAYNYLPFGGFMGGNYEIEKITDYLYTGQELEGYTAGGIDYLRLYNYKARFYDSDLGRFYSTDPAGEFASPYMYAGNNPVSFIDPNGEMSGAAWAGLTIGVALIGIGAAVLGVVTFGTAIPAIAPILAAAGTTAVTAVSIAGTAALAAGISGVVYSATHSKEGEFNWGAYFGVIVVSGAVGAASAGVGIGIGAAGFSAGAVFLAEAGAGFVFGAAEGYVTTGILTGEWGWTAVGGAAAGGVLGGAIGGLGGVLGRGVNVRNAGVAKAGKGSDLTLIVGEHGGVGPINHSVVGLRRGRRRLYDLTADNLHTPWDVIKGGQNTRFGTYSDFDFGKARAFELGIPESNSKSAQTFISGSINNDQGAFNIFTNGCTVWAKKVVRKAGLEPPLWAQTATSLTFWFRSTGAAASKSKLH